MNNVKESLKILASVANHRLLIDNFARDKYRERFGVIKHQEGTYHFYEGYDVISETELRVKYAYGAGDMDFNDFFIVEL